jgi:hypothetical protein
VKQGLRLGGDADNSDADNSTGSASIPVTAESAAAASMSLNSSSNSSITAVQRSSSSTSLSAAEEMEKRFKETMHRIFWDVRTALHSLTVHSEHQCKLVAGAASKRSHARCYHMPACCSVRLYTVLRVNGVEQCAIKNLAVHAQLRAKVCTLRRVAECIVAARCICAAGAL